jgi:hypothetical protein
MIVIKAQKIKMQNNSKYPIACIFIIINEKNDIQAISTIE